MSEPQKQNQTVPSAQTNPSSNSTVQTTAGRNSDPNGAQQTFPPINSLQAQNPASQQQLQQSSQINATGHLPVIPNQPQNANIHIDEESDEEYPANQQFTQPQPPPPQYQPPPPPSSSDVKTAGSGRSKDKLDYYKEKSKLPFGLKIQPRICRPTRGIKIDNLEKYLKEYNFQSYLNELEIVELFADSGITTTVYVLLVGGYLITKKIFQIQHLITKYSEKNKLDKPVNDNLLAALVGLISEPNSIDMWKNVVGLYEKDLPTQKCLSEYSKLFPLLTCCMKEVMNKKEVELTEQQEIMRKYLLEKKNNEDRTFSTIEECAKNLTEVDPNISK